jgi:ABC-2 type transport system permease protein
LIEGRAVYVIVSREFKKFVRERSRFFSTIARPLLWLFLVGGGLSRLVPVEGDITYMQFLYPGILGMTVLFSSIFSAISIIWDKEFGYMKEILVAPVSRTSIVVGKALSGTVVSTIQAIIILFLFPLLGLRLEIYQIVLVIVISFGLSFAISSIGILIATFYDSFESFSVIMNFIVMPMFFLSGAMYPVKALPKALMVIAQFNPLTYGIDALKNVIFPFEKGSMGPDFSLSLDLIVIILVSVIFTALGTVAFKRRI